MDNSALRSVDYNKIWSLIDVKRVRRVVDIGCHQGEHIKTILKTNFPTAEIIGIEPKESNFSKCLDLKIERVSFLKLDCRKLHNNEIGEFDFIWCFGLIYHLDDPTLLIKSLASITNRSSYVCIEGHLATYNEQAQMSNPNPPIVDKILDGEIYFGKLYKEFDTGVTPEQKDMADKASLDNPTAFWLTYESIIRMFYKYGFRRIYELKHENFGPRVFLKDHDREWSRYGFLIQKTC